MLPLHQAKHHRKDSSNQSPPLPPATAVLEVTPLLDDGNWNGKEEKGNTDNKEATTATISSLFFTRRRKHCQPCCCVESFRSCCCCCSRLWERVRTAVVVPFQQQQQQQLDRDGVRFAMRMSVILSFCTLFVLCGWIDHGFWVYVTVLNVSWFPRLDAASVMEKTMQRWMGTMLGAFLGLACGFLSLLIPEHPQHEIFLFTATAVVVLGVLAAAGTIQIGGGKRIIDMYSYATCLCMLTLGVALLPFASVERDIWKVGVFRVLNVSIGCCIGAAGSILLWPRPTLQMLHQKTARQVVLAGQASEAVLHAAVDAFSGKRRLPLLSQELLQTRYNFITQTVRNQERRQRSDDDDDDDNDGKNPADAALEKYEDAIQDWMASRNLFRLLPFDPFSLLERRRRNQQSAEASDETDIATTLARALRIQTTVVVLDGMIRYDVNKSNYNFTDETLQIFTETGTLIRQLLTLPIMAQPDQQQSDATTSTVAAVVQALFAKLEAIRARARRAAAALVVQADDADAGTDDALVDFQNRLLRRTPQQSTRMDDNRGRGLPMYTATSLSYHCSHRLLFFQLVEHLILRALRLYHQISTDAMHEKLCGGGSARRDKK